MSKKKTYGCQKRRPIGVKKEDLSVKKVHFNTFLSFPVLLHTGYNYITHDMSLAHLERARAAHVQNETLERDIASEFSRPGVDGTHKRRLAQSHRVRGMLDRMRANGKKLKRYYADEDGSRKEEVERTGGRNNNNNNNKGGGGNKNTNEDGENAVFETFYGALKELKKKKKDDDDHKRKRFVSEEEETLSSAAALREKLEEAQKFEAQKERLKKKLSKKSNNGTKEQQEVAENDARLDPNSERLPDGVDFSGEEHQGRYLDLVRFHHAFVADVARTFGVSFTDEVKKNAAKKRKMEHHQQQQQQQQKATKTQKSEEKEEDKKDDEDDDDDDEETKRKPLEYVAFLHELPNLFDGEKTTNLDRSKKFSKTYVSFCEELYEYLVDFLERASPLQFARDVLVPEEIDEEFEKIFEKGDLKGWEDKGVVASTRNNNNNNTLDLSVVKDIAKGKNASSSKALKSNMKDEEIKDALSKAGLKTGGTPDERCERLFQVAKLVSAAKGNDATIPSKYIRKGVVVGGGSGADGKKDEEERRLKTQIERAKHIARLEYRLKILFAGALRKTLDNTKSQAEKKLTMSREEIEREHEEDDDFAFSDVDEDEDEMNKEIYNPLKLPMGWDGKPIPYWLYKLHGLNIEFKCEICGNYSYWGRRAYEQHFTQWRHQHGMRCLNIPFSKAFNEVTTIEEARRLHQTLEEKKLGKWDRQHDQECEDADGNVYNAKTFAELRSQGLI